ncbi:MAG: hypothetical protein QXL01_07485, partial [Thermoplasmatales archaeon]
MMSQFYDRNYRVKVWVILDGLTKKKTKMLLDWFKEAEAHIVQWPAKTFKDTLEELKSRGWTHIFEKDSAGKIILPSQFLNIAFLEHLRKTNPVTMMSNIVTKPVHYLNREVLNDNDYERIFNDMMGIFEPQYISFVFNIGKLCHFDDKQVKVFVSEGPAPKNVLASISENLITIK